MVNILVYPLRLVRNYRKLFSREVDHPSRKFHRVWINIPDEYKQSVNTVDRVERSRRKRRERFLDTDSPDSRNLIIFTSPSVREEENHLPVVTRVTKLKVPLCSTLAA